MNDEYITIYREYFDDGPYFKFLEELVKHHTPDFFLEDQEGTVRKWKGFSVKEIMAHPSCPYYKINEKFLHVMQSYDNLFLINLTREYFSLSSSEEGEDEYYGDFFKVKLRFNPTYENILILYINGVWGHFEGDIYWTASFYKNFHRDCLKKLLEAKSTILFLEVLLLLSGANFNGRQGYKLGIKEEDIYMIQEVVKRFRDLTGKFRLLYKKALLISGESIGPYIDSGFIEDFVYPQVEQFQTIKHFSLFLDGTLA